MPNLLFPCFTGNQVLFMIFKTLKYCMPVACIILSVLGTGCNLISDSVTQDDTIFIPDQSEKVFRIDSLFIFNTRKNYSVTFSGERFCTLAVDDSILTIENDSLYFRITCRGDTMLSIGDSTYGTALFLPGDIANWGVLLVNLKDTGNFLGNTIRARLSASEKAIIQSTELPMALPDSFKTTVVEILNSILDSTAFYFIHRKEIKKSIFYIPIIDSLNQEVNHLITASIMLDTTGEVNPVLTTYEREKLRWFYWSLFTRYIDNEFANEDIGKAFQKYPTTGRIYTFHFQQGPAEISLYQQSVTRFIEVKHTGMSQIAYLDKNGFQTLSDVTISDYPIMTDTSLNVTTFFMVPEPPFISGRDILSLLVSGKSVIAYNNMSANGADTAISYTVNFYYLLSGERVYNGKPVSMVGTVSLSAGVYKVLGFDSQRDQGYFTGWRTESNMQMVNASGKRTRYKECYYLHSDDSP